MKIASQVEKISSFKHLELLSYQVVEGLVSGMHKSPFHGFSAEFSEHKVYNTGESTRHVDWKLYAKTDRLYSKCFEEETNLRCHIIIDNSSSMHYPKLDVNQNFYENKIGFSVLAAAVLMALLKKQRDAVGLSVFSDRYEYYAPEKGSDRHHRMLLNTLENLLENQTPKKTTDTITYLHQIAEKMHRRSMILLFTDMFQSDSISSSEEKLFAALQHLKHNKHKVVLFHVMDYKTEYNFDFDASPRRFVDLESGEEIAVFADNVKEAYEIQMKEFTKKVAMSCAQNRIVYVPVRVDDNFEKIITTYLVEKQSFG
jgi:uncharacterized protein (DUF58 family)